MILYLHGFRSSPLSAKSQCLAARMKALGRAHEWLCPQLPASPAQAATLMQELTQPYAPQDICLIGSSLGGYYATWLAERLGCRAVLLNPGVFAGRDLSAHVGRHRAYHSDEPFEFKASYLDELQALAVERITRPERYFLVAATGDEVLDWQEMVRHYPGARHKILQGSDHGISEFPHLADEVLAFCGIG
jgi:predicted esterase YcpF (UPF0227 family)